MSKEIFEALGKISFHDFDFDFDGESVASDSIFKEIETENYSVNITVKAWVRDTLWWGLELYDIEIEEFVIWDKNGDEVNLEINENELIKSLNILK